MPKKKKPAAKTTGKKTLKGSKKMGSQKLMWGSGIGGGV